MLTWSNWDQEMRSNRYHYAIRFAKEVPVFFVQPDHSSNDYTILQTEVENVFVVHVNSKFDIQQRRSIQMLIDDQKIANPLFWVYNSDFWELLYEHRRSTIVYHATEDYFSNAFNQGVRGYEISVKLRFVLSLTDLLVSVSDGVENNFQVKGNFSNQSVMVGNGCDYSFWQLTPDELNWVRNKPNTKIALYQGGIGRKLDFELLNHLVRSLDDWLFLFAGTIFDCQEEFKQLLKHKNVAYLGYLPVNRVREYALIADIGLNPFVCNDWTIKRGFPLKAFEYLSVGLPVVSIPIRSLLQYRDVFYFAHNKYEFESIIRTVAVTRTDPVTIEIRAKAAKSTDYKMKFEEVLGRLEKLQLVGRSKRTDCLQTRLSYFRIYAFERFLKCIRKLKRILR